MYFSSILIITTICILQVQYCPVSGESLEDELQLSTHNFIKSIYESTKTLEEHIANFRFKKKELDLSKKLIKDKLEKIPTKCHSEQLQHHVSSFISWDFNSCVNLTDDMKIESEIVLNGLSMAVNISQTLGNIGNNLLNCSSQSITKVLSCYNQNLKDLKQNLGSIRNQTAPIVDEIINQTVQLKNDFQQCLGIPNAMKNKIERRIKSNGC